jgi:hypothetical protein
MIVGSIAFLHHFKFFLFWVVVKHWASDEALGTILLYYFNTKGLRLWLTNEKCEHL